jgi:drug/metabolite transporter (DMT)-like permease
LEKKKIRKIYETLERNVLILMAIPIPFFAIIFLSSQNGTLDYDIPEFPAFWDYFGLGFVYALLGLHYIAFHSAINKINAGNFELEKKVKMYANATIFRFWVLFVSVFICAAGLLFFKNSGYTIAFAITLVFSSLGKPTPDRIIRLLRLKGEEKEEIGELKRPG